MPRTRQQAGRLSRNKGKAFERRVAKEVMPELTGHPHWKRTQRGDKQNFGDLEPCTKDGVQVWLDTKSLTLTRKYYVECRSRAVLSATEIRKWQAEVQLAATAVGSSYWILIVKQDRGPIWAFVSEARYSIVGEAEMF